MWRTKLIGIYLDLANMIEQRMAAGGTTNFMPKKH